MERGHAACTYQTHGKISISEASIPWVLCLLQCHMIVWHARAAALVQQCLPPFLNYNNAWNNNTCVQHSEQCYTPESSNLKIDPGVIIVNPNDKVVIVVIIIVIELICRYNLTIISLSSSSDGKWSLLQSIGIVA